MNDIEIPGSGFLSSLHKIKVDNPASPDDGQEFYVNPDNINFIAAADKPYGNTTRKVTKIVFKSSDPLYIDGLTVSEVLEQIDSASMDYFLRNAAHYV